MSSTGTNVFRRTAAQAGMPCSRSARQRCGSSATARRASRDGSRRATRFRFASLLPPRAESQLLAPLPSVRMTSARLSPGRRASWSRRAPSLHGRRLRRHPRTRRSRWPQCGDRQSPTNLRNVVWLTTLADGERTMPTNTERGSNKSVTKAVPDFTKGRTVSRRSPRCATAFSTAHGRCRARVRKVLPVCSIGGEWPHPFLQPPRRVARQSRAPHACSPAISAASLKDKAGSSQWS